MKRNTVAAGVLASFLMISFVSVVGGHGVIERWRGSISVLNAPPSLNAGSVSPENGTPGTTFTYEVTYADPEGDPPSYVRVYIDGVEYSMTGISGSFTDGFLYRYQTNVLDAGDHDYYFTASDGINVTRLPESGAYPGPTLVLRPTSLSVSPSSFTAGYGENLFLTVTLTSDNVPLANKTVLWEASVGGVAPASSLTDDAGRATATYTAPQITTSGVVVVQFAGDFEYAPSEASVSFEVRFSVALTFTKPDGSPLADTEIYYGMVEGEENLFLGTTDSLGKIVSTDPDLAGKTLYFRSADGRYAGSMLVSPAGGTVSVPAVEITEFPLAPVVILAIALAATLGGAIVWKRVLSKPKMPKPELEARPPRPPVGELDRRLFSYLVERKGELSISDASRELGVSPDEVRAALERLKKAGKIEIE
jgi:DNA-binding transcriptional ArsR family regulator